jgi:hypothetical protein
MRNFRYFAVALSILWVTNSQAFVPHVDLKDSKAVAEGQCNHNEVRYKCFVVAKEDKFYIVAVDNKGVVAVYSVKDMQQDYNDEDATLIWQRDEIKRRRKDEV